MISKAGLTAVKGFKYAGINAGGDSREKGYKDAKSCVSEVSNLLGLEPGEVYIGSTGVIGQKLETDNILRGIGKAAEQLMDGENKALDFIEAIMTTDTRVKQASVSFEIGGKTINIASCVKGAGMIMPDMATMRSLLTKAIQI